MTDSLDYSDIIWELNREIKKVMKQESIAGLSIALIDRDQIIWDAGYGHTDFSTKTTVTSDTLFSSQSLAKSITATAFMVLVSKGLVKLDDPIQKHYPEFSVNTRFGTPQDEISKITFRRLLNMSAGLTQVAPVGNCYGSTGVTFEEHIQSISDSWLRSPVGSEQAYSTISTDLVAHTMGRIMNSTFQEVMDESLFQPLGIELATYNFEEAIERGFARGHSRDYEIENQRVSMLGGAGVYISAMDIAKIVSLHIMKGKYQEKQLIDPKILKEMYEPQFGQDSPYRLGMYTVKKILDAEVYGHGGEGYGFQNNMMWIPEYEIGVVVLTNEWEHGGKQTYFCERALELMAIEKRKHIQTEISTDHLKRLEGTYRTEGFPFFRIISDNYSLKAHTVFDTKWHLFPESETEFITEKGEKHKFKLDDEGKPSSITMPGYLYPVVAHYNDGPLDETGKDHKTWEEHLGLYEFFDSERRKFVALSMMNGHLHLIIPDMLKLKHHQDSIFFTADGEAVVLGDGTLSFRNIPARKVKYEPEKIVIDFKEGRIHLESFKPAIASLVLVVYISQGLDTILKFMESMVKIDSSLARYYNSIGRRAFALERLEDAKRCFDLMLKNDTINEYAIDMLERTNYILSKLR